MKTVKQAAEKLGISARRVRVLAAAGRIDGAEKAGRDWIFPDKLVVRAVDRSEAFETKVKMR